GPLRAHHERTVFLLTKSDLVDGDEIPDVIAAVRRRLRDVGIDAPVLLTCAPEAALRELAACGPHLREFTAVERRIARLAAERRDAAISATLLGLLRELLSALEEMATAQQRRLSAVEEASRRLSLPDLPAFLNAWLTRTSARIDAAMSAIRTLRDPVRSQGEIDQMVSSLAAGQ